MKNLILVSISILCFPSCTPENATQSPAKSESVKPLLTQDLIQKKILGKRNTDSKPDLTKWEGIYSAQIPKENSETRRILFSIETISDKKIKGYSMLHGIKTPLDSSYRWDEASKKITAQILAQSWTTNEKESAPLRFILDEKGLRLSEVLKSKSGKLNSIYLKKTKFAYNKKARLTPRKNWFFTTPQGPALVSRDAIRLNGSLQVLDDDVLKNLTGPNLRIIRNVIFARHGYAFKKESMRTFFESNRNRWYLPLFDNVEAKLTQIERVNVAKLRRFEKYDREYEDGFGR